MHRQHPPGRWRTATLHMMSRGERWQYAIFALVWLLLSANFWIWWLTPGHSGNLALYIAVSAALFYSAYLLPTFYLFYLGQMRRPVQVDVREVEEAGIVGRVAVVSLTVPGSESLAVVERQLAAMQGIRYPHDSWILVDKEHSPEIEALAERYGVRYFSRHDVAKWGDRALERWNAPGPPFQAKTKAGNVNAWLDQFGDGYSHFTQLDIDHLPYPTYLDRVLGFFKDERVAWVQAPSVYGNLEHWTARGSTEQEFVLQGPLQMGFFGFCRTPFIIGSHCTYDMAAIREIGGFQPTRAEDHLDTVYLAAADRQGVFLPEVIAVGDGPETFDTYLSQQFAWAFSMIQVLFTYTPRLIWNYSPRQALQFVFVQTWYTCWSLSMVVLFFAPLLSLTFDAPISQVQLHTFLLHSLPVGITATAVWWWSHPWHQPRGVGLSWRGVVLHVARWVVVLSAFVQVLLRVKKPYMITTKGIGGGHVPPFRLAVLRPYLLLIGAALAACWLYLAIYDSGPSQGYLFFGLLGALLFWLLTMIVIAQDARTLAQAGIPFARRLRERLGVYAVAASVTAMLLVTAAVSYGRIVEAVTL